MKVGFSPRQSNPRPRMAMIVTMQCGRAAIAKKAPQEKLFARQNEAKQSATPENSESGQ